MTETEGPGQCMAPTRVDRVRRLLCALDRGTVGRLFDATAPAGEGRPGGNIPATLLEVLRGRRRAHARRLWTRWLEPVMLRDAVTLAQPHAVPGCLHFIDAAAWWTALARRMAPLAARIQDAVNERAGHAPLDAVLSSTEAARWTEELRRGTLSELDAMRRSPLARGTLLAEVNVERQRLTGAGDLRLLDDRDLEALIITLETAPALRGADSVQAAPPPVPASAGA